MRLIKGIIDAVLMATLIKPMVRLTVGRWRRRVQESPATVIGLQVQELFETALVEELAPAVTELESAPAASSIEIIEAEAGRSAFRVLLVAGVVMATTTAAAYGIAELVRRRREAQAAERKLVAVPIEEDAAEAIEDVAQEAVAEER